MIIFLILEHAIAKWYSYQPSIIISNPSPSVIHHHHISIIFIHPSSSHIDHHQSSIIITYGSSWVIHHHHISIIFSHPSSSHIDHLHSSIIIKYQRDLFCGRMLGFSRKGILLMNMNIIIFHLASHISDLLSSLIYHHR